MMQVPRDVIKAVPVTAEQPGLEAVQIRERDENPAVGTEQSRRLLECLYGIGEVLEDVPEREGIEAPRVQLCGLDAAGNEPEGRDAACHQGQRFPGEVDSGAFPAPGIQRQQEPGIAAPHIENVPAPDERLHNPDFFLFTAPGAAGDKLP